MARIRLGAVDEIPEGGMIMRGHEGAQILLARVDGRIYAMNDICTHEGAPLHEGSLGGEGKCLLTCPWHAAHFDIRTGTVLQDTPWATDTETYPVEISGADVYVEL
ncbi:MAG: Rieske (2Fe-2S) protein [Thermoanaerobaculia bacterium]